MEPEDRIDCGQVRKDVKEVKRTKRRLSETSQLICIFIAFWIENTINL
jgi:hypothetical protein